MPTPRLRSIPLVLVLAAGPAILGLLVTASPALATSCVPDPLNGGANIAAHEAVEEHRQKINTIERAITDIKARQKRLFKILEDNDDDGGALYQQAKQRQQELDAEYARKRTELGRVS